MATNITFERFLSFMFWCNMFVHDTLLWKDVVTNITFERLLCGVFGFEGWEVGVIWSDKCISEIYWIFYSDNSVYDWNYLALLGSVICPFAIVNLARYLMCNVNGGSPGTKESVSIVQIGLTKSPGNLRVIWSESSVDSLAIGPRTGAAPWGRGLRIPV